MTNNAATLSNRAMLVKLSISQWTARKLDRKVTKETTERYGAERDAGNFHKALIAQTAIKEVNKTANAARSFHYENTLPWTDEGFRILPAANFANYSEKMRQLRADFEAAVAKLVTNYPDLVDQARLLLNGMFNAADYPGVDDIGRRFGFDVGIMPLPDAADFRVSLQADQIAAIQADIGAKVQDAQTAAMRDLWDRAYKAVKHMAEKLTDKTAIFRDSLVNNLCELAELLPALNIADDPDLERMRRDIEDKLCKYDPQTLRDEQDTRKDTAKAADDILSKMAGFIG